jgi:hypothetical protein
VELLSAPAEIGCLLLTPAGAALALDPRQALLAAKEAFNRLFELGLGSVALAFAAASSKPIGRHCGPAGERRPQNISASIAVIFVIRYYVRGGIFNAKIDGAAAKPERALPRADRSLSRKSAQSGESSQNTIFPLENVTATSSTRS